MMKSIKNEPRTPTTEPTEVTPVVEQKSKVIVPKPAAPKKKTIIFSESSICPWYMRWVGEGTFHCFCCNEEIKESQLVEHLKCTWEADDFELKKRKERAHKFRPAWVLSSA